MSQSRMRFGAFVAPHVPPDENPILAFEHDMDIVSRYCQRVIAFYSGRIIADDVPSVALANAEVRRYVTGERDA